MSEGYVIGVDHGYAAMKTVHGSFPSGLVAYEHEPYTQKNVLEYGGTYYMCSSNSMRGIDPVRGRNDTEGRGTG